MNTNLPDAGVNPGLTLDEQLLEIYWAKKELDDFLPTIARYAQPYEVANIALSQLAMIEKRVIWILEAKSRGQLYF